eukprot:ANDGO_00122.mRNA.1 General transcription factor IIH subunit 1
MSESEKVLFSAPCSIKNVIGIVSISSRKLIFHKEHEVGSVSKKPTLVLAIQSISAVKANATNAKGRVLLQISFASKEASKDDSYVLDFSGTANASESRDMVRDILQHWKANPPKDDDPAAVEETLRLRKTVLEMNPQMKSLHQELVVNRKMLTDTEFWDRRNEAIHARFLAMESGVENKLSAEQPITSSATKKVTLTARDKHAILQNHVSIRRAYKRMVPLDCTEKEFWSIILRSAYFHRVDEDDATESASKEDSKSADRSRKILEKLKSLQAEDAGDTSWEDLISDLKHITGRNNLSRNEESDAFHGLRTDDAPLDHASDPRIALFRKINRHSELVVDRVSLVADNVVDDLPELRASKKKRLVPLSVRDYDTYFEKSLSAGDAKLVAERRNGLSMFPTTPLSIFEEIADASSTVLKEDAPFIGQSGQGKGGTQSEFVDKLKSLFLSLNEILTHFWHTFGHLAVVSQNQQPRLREFVKAVEKLSGEFRDLKARCLDANVSQTVFASISAAVNNVQSNQIARAQVFAESLAAKAR